MAEEAAEGRSPARPWSRLWSEALPPVVYERWFQVSLLTAGFFLFTFCVYWFLGPKDTPYVHHVNQANAFIHGRLDIHPDYAKNANLLERALDLDVIEQVKQGITPPPCGEVKCYLTHPPLPAILLVPLVAVSGLSVNQALVSAVFGALTAALVYRVTRTMTERIPSQIWFTALFIFGSIFWYTSTHGGVWFMSHTVAVLFIFLAIYAALVPKNALLAGIALGAAFLSRNDSAWVVIFLLVMFSPQWLHWSNDRPLLKRVDLKPLLQIAAGAIPFIAFALIFNYLRFDDPFESGYTRSEQIYQPSLSYLYVDYKLFDFSYIQRHIPVVFEQTPDFKTEPPYVIPQGFGMAIWVTTPAFLYALFAEVRDRRLIGALGVALAASCFAIFWTAASAGWDLGSLRIDLTDSKSVFEHFPLLRELPDWPWLAWQFLPFYAAIIVAVAAAVRVAVKRGELLLIACWGSILPIAFTNFLFAATGWTHFGYRYALEFYPFLFLLTIQGMGAELKWHHKVVIALSVLLNFLAILWIFQFRTHETFGWTWTNALP